MKTVLEVKMSKEDLEDMSLEEYRKTVVRQTRSVLDKIEGGSVAGMLGPVPMLWDFNFDNFNVFTDE